MKKLFFILFVLAGIQTFAQSAYRTRAEDDANPELDNLNGVNPDGLDDFSDFGSSMSTSTTIEGVEGEQTNDTFVAGQTKGSPENGPKGLADMLISIYPNPASNYVIIQLTDSYPVRVDFISLVGQVVYSVTITDKENFIDITQLQQGVYFVGFEANNEKVVKKIRVTE